MNISRFFIDRPIFAAVLSLMIVAAGALALFQLPISEYPQVVPPTVVVHAAYPARTRRSLPKRWPRRSSSR
jgi:multidrug efflux pump subunit AcrB